MSRRHPKSRKERLALRSRLGKKFTDARERVVRRVNRRGQHALESKADDWKRWNLAAE